MEGRGIKQPEGVTKTAILLIALQYPDGIEEPLLVEEIQDKLKIGAKKNITGHLLDLGPGRKKPGSFYIREGKHYLVLMPSKCVAKNKRDEILNAQKLRENYIKCEQTNFWKPTNDLKKFKQIIKEILKSGELNDHSALLKTETFKRNRKTLLNDFLEDFNPLMGNPVSDWSENNKLMDFMQSPSFVNFILTSYNKNRILSLIIIAHIREKPSDFSDIDTLKATSYFDTKELEYIIDFFKDKNIRIEKGEVLEALETFAYLFSMADSFKYSLNIPKFDFEIVDLFKKFILDEGNKIEEVRKAKFSFELDSRLKKELNKKYTSKELCDVFKERGFLLSEEYSIGERLTDFEWRITNKREFIIRKEDGKLNVYEK